VQARIGGHRCSAKISTAQITHSGRAASFGSSYGRPTGVSSFTAMVVRRRTLSAIDEISRKPSGAARHDLEGADRLRGMRHKKARRYLEVIRQRHSPIIAANKLSVTKRTGKFSTWSDDAATQQVAANRERTVSSSTDLFSTPSYSLMLIWALRQNCRSLHAHRHDSESCSGSDGAHQRRGVDLIGHGGLCQIDDREEQEFGVVEDRETLHLGGGKGE
jgi:hypothetical protein